MCSHAAFGLSLAVISNRDSGFNWRRRWKALWVSCLAGEEDECALTKLVVTVDVVVVVVVVCPVAFDSSWPRRLFGLWRLPRRGSKLQKSSKIITTLSRPPDRPCVSVDSLDLKGSRRRQPLAAESSQRRQRNYSQSALDVVVLLLGIIGGRSAWLAACNNVVVVLVNR